MKLSGKVQFVLLTLCTAGISILIGNMIKSPPVDTSTSQATETPTVIASPTTSVPTSSSPAPAYATFYPVVRNNTTQLPQDTSTPTLTPTPTPTPEGTETPTPTPTDTPTLTETPIPTPTDSPTPTDTEVPN